jgi:hypothetical protein
MSTGLLTPDKKVHHSDVNRTTNTNRQRVQSKRSEQDYEHQTTKKLHHNDVNRTVRKNEWHLSEESTTRKQRKNDKQTKKNKKTTKKQEKQTTKEAVIKRE